MTRVIEVESLSRRYRKGFALRGITFAIDRGETVGLVGPNGAGKTTLLKLLCGALSATTGTVRLFGESPRGLSDPGPRLGFVLDPPGLPPSASPYEILTIEAMSQGLSRKRVGEAVGEFGLSRFARQRFGRLSLGQRQRTVLASACIGRPQLLLLDEPTNGLDVDAIQWLRRLIRDRHDDGLTTLVSSHNLPELERVADRTLVLNQTLRFDGPGLLAPDGNAEDRYSELISQRGDK